MSNTNNMIQTLILDGQEPYGSIYISCTTRKKTRHNKYYCNQKKKNGVIYILLRLLVFFLYIYNSNLNILPKFKIVARITLLHLNVLL